MNGSITGVILAGGQNKRFDREQKTFFTIDGSPIFQRIYDVMQAVFDEVVIVTNTPLLYLPWDAAITTDVHAHRSSLTGIHAGLFFVKTPYAFFAACDAPFLQKPLVETIVANVEANVDVVVPETAKGYEPLCAVYARPSLRVIEAALARGVFTIRSVFDRLRVKTIDEATLRPHDPELASFFNVNTKKELEKARQWYANKHRAV
ncbi:MAG: molybdenum cofactor guanylyltransferase [Thermodesulfobacteriota bacterium]|nr:molybdenum cofactor guanylyltransferase [Thermodesulfobacteriota bacterium]